MPHRVSLFRNLLIAICLFLISYPVVINEGVYGRIFEAILGIGILRTGIMATTPQRTPPKWSQGLLILLISCWVLELLAEDRFILNLVRLALLQFFLVRFTLKVGRDVLITERIDASGRLYGAICVYLLIAASFANLYLIMDQTWPSAFTCASVLCSNLNGERVFYSGTHLYFSLVTLSSVGYGDITPAHPFSAMSVAIEAIVGQMYVAIVISRLVSIHLNQSSQKH